MLDKTLPKLDFEEILDEIGFGKYSLNLMITCCLLLLGMYIDVFGVSMVLPMVSCDMGLSTSEQAFLSAVPLIGIMTTTYAWGLTVDTIGRKKTLIISMPFSVVFSIAASFAPNFSLFAVLKLLSAGLASSAHAAAFVLIGESVPARYRSNCMFILVSATICVQMILGAIAIPIFQMNFNIDLLPSINLTYRSWRLYLQVSTLPAIFGLIGLITINESPKFLLNKNNEASAIKVLNSMNNCNNGKKVLAITSVHLNEPPPLKIETSFFKTIWNQTAPLFKPPLLKNSFILYYILLCALMTSTGFIVWSPTLMNAYFSSDDVMDKTFCNVASTATTIGNQTSDCDNIIEPMTLYIMIVSSGLAAICTMLMTSIVRFIGNKKMTILILSISILSGIILLFIRQRIISIVSFYVFLYVALVLGSINTYLVELYPVHLRGMSTSLSIIVTRGFGFISVQIIGLLLPYYCSLMVTGYMVLLISGLIVAFFLPSDKSVS